MRGAVSPLAIQIPKLSPHPPPPPPPSHGLSAISLAEQLAQHALLQLGRRALRLAARLQEFEEKLLEIVLLLARRAIFEMVPDFLLAQHALLQLGRRALRLAARLQEFEEKLLEIVLLLARRAIFEMVPDFPLELWGQLAVQKLVQMQIGRAHV